MRPNPRIVPRPLAAATVTLLAAVLLGHAGAVRAQSETSALATGVEAGIAGVLADVIPATRSAPLVPLAPLAPPQLQAATFRTAPAGTATARRATQTAPAPLDDTLAANRIGPVDDQTLSRQRGGAVGMVMVAATPQLMRGGTNVTLWDELAPPAAPIPIPADSSQAAQGNVATYTRK